MPPKPIRKGQVQIGLAPKPETQAPDTVDSMLDKVEAELQKEGVVLFDNSDIMNEYLRLPADLTEVEPRDLGRYFNTFTKQKLWVRTLLSRTSAILREKNEELEDIKLKVYSGLPPKMSVTEKELNLRQDERAKELISEVSHLEEKRNVLDSYLESLVDGIFNISREISRRTSDWKDLNREENMGRNR